MKFKNLILFIGLFASSFLSGFAQNNSFPTENAIWNYRVGAENSLTGQSQEKTVYYTICGDTIVEDYIYNKLYETWDTVICGNNLRDFIGGFRQEEQKVYFIPYNKAVGYPYYYPAYFGEEFLLYDFGVSIGDTIHIEYNCRYYLFTWQYQNLKGFHFDIYNPRMLIVSNIEVENGIKKIILEGEHYDIWYEGIGSPYGFFNSGYPDLLDGYSFGFSLQCFKYDDTVKYKNNSECNTCFCQNFIDIKEEKINIGNINIFPNPTNNILKIEGVENIKSINIYSIYGKLIEKNMYKFNTD